MSRYTSGLQGEQIAQDYLTRQGMVCLGQRCRGESGELDLVMEDGDCVVFVEVKYRPGGRRGSGLLAVTPDKQRRMGRAALKWLVDNDRTGSSVRFDVIEITADGILHIPNAFYPPV